MGTDVIKIVDVFAHQSLQVTLTENDDVIQAFAPNTTDEALADGVGFWRTHRCFENINMAGNKREVGAELIIIVTDQKPWAFLKRRGIASLLSDPRITG